MLLDFHATFNGRHWQHLSAPHTILTCLLAKACAWTGVMMGNIPSCSVARLVSVNSRFVDVTFPWTWLHPTSKWEKHGKNHGKPCHQKNRKMIILRPAPGHGSTPLPGQPWSLPSNLAMTFHLEIDMAWYGIIRLILSWETAETWGFPFVSFPCFIYLYIYI